MTEKETTTNDSNNETVETVADGEMLNLEMLEEIPHINEQYDETYLWGIPQSPRSALAVYEIGSGTREHLRATYGDDFFDNNYLILRVHRFFSHGESAFDVEDFLDDKNSYWLDLDPDCDYTLELGFRAKNTSFFECVASSNRFHTPPAATTTEERYCEWRSVDIEDKSVELEVGEDEWQYNLFQYWKQRKVDREDENGTWALVLHNHLPFVHHPEHKISFEEQWLFEAVGTCYLQMLDVFWRLDSDKIDFRITMSFSSTLVSMLQNPSLKMRTGKHLEELAHLCEKELENAGGQPQEATLKEQYARIQRAREIYANYDGDILRGFRDFQNMGKLEIIIVPGTHPIMPLYMHYPENIRGHVQIACRQYNDAFGCWPRGAWLPENAFAPGVDKILKDEGIRWTLVNSTGILRGDTAPFYGTNRPVITPNGLAVFGIDEDTRSQVWSRESGYPGDGRYKEWYRDLGYDADWDYLPDYWKIADVRRNTGVKYYRITGKDVELNEKAYYHPEAAHDAIEQHASQFVCHRGAQAYNNKERFGVHSMVVSAYDGELFGHWWEEGPQWIEMVFRKMACDQTSVRPVTPGEFLAEQPTHQMMMPGMSTWGKQSNFSTWLDGREYRPNTWPYRHLYRLIAKMTDLATANPTADGVLARALNQAARELMLAQASDWAFLISTEQACRYSELRIIRHIDRTRALLEQIETNSIDETYLEILETSDNVFPFDKMDFRVFSR